jgi:hypothetical protein
MDLVLVQYGPNWTFIDRVDVLLCIHRELTDCAYRQQ